MSFLRDKQGGATLIEILITLLIMSVGMLGLSGLQVNSVKANLDAGQQSQAMWIVQEVAERMRSNQAGLASYKPAADAISAAPPPCASVAAIICSDNPLRAAVPCTAAAMAAHDIAEAYCGYQVNNVRTDSAESIDLQSLEITEENRIIASYGLGNPPITETYYTVELKWRSNLARDARERSEEDGAIADRYQGADDQDITTIYTFAP